MTDPSNVATPGGVATPTPGRPAQDVDGLLTVDLENRRARYDCFRVDCEQRREGPVRGDVVPEFVRAIKTQHLAQFHGEQR